MCTRALYHVDHAQFLVFIIFNLSSSRKTQRLALLLDHMDRATHMTYQYLQHGNLGFGATRCSGTMGSLSYVYANPCHGLRCRTCTDFWVGTLWICLVFISGDNSGKLSNVIRRWLGYFWL